MGGESLVPCQAATRQRVPQRAPQLRLTLCKTGLCCGLQDHLFTEGLKKKKELHNDQKLRQKLIMEHIEKALVPFASWSDYKLVRRTTCAAGRELRDEGTRLVPGGTESIQDSEWPNTTLPLIRARSITNKD